MWLQGRGAVGEVKLASGQVPITEGLVGWHRSMTCPKSTEELWKALSAEKA